MEEKELLANANAFFDSKKYNELIELVDDNRSVIQKKYHEFNILYIRSLCELKQFDKALNLLDEELSMPYIPLEYDQVYRSIVQEVAQEVAPEYKIPQMSEDEIKELLNKRPIDEKFLDASISLKDKNIRNYLEEIKNIISDSSIPNACKAVLLMGLKGQEVSIDLDFVSPRGNKKINSLDYVLPLDKEYEVIFEAYKIINELSKDYNFKESMKIVATGIAISFMPFEIEKEDVNELVAACYYRSCEMLSMPISMDKLLDIFSLIDKEKTQYFIDVVID